ncbi:MAG: response regulator [Burkholderiaceae bacterium]
MRILFVEDNSIDSDLVSRALVASGIDPPDVAPTLADARRMLAEAGRYDLVLTDLGLPDGNGIELVLELRAQASGLAIVVLTSAGDEQLVLAALRAGADDYLAKTVDYFERLPATLAAALVRSKADHEWRTRRLRVLYAEHNACDVDLTRRHFDRHAPYILLEIVDSMAGVMERLPEGHAAEVVDVLLLDYRLSGDSGLEVLKHVREDRALDLPVVMVTGQGSEDVAAHAMRLGATDYVIKHAGYLDVLPQTLSSAFHRVVAERRHVALTASQAHLSLLNASLERRVAERTRDLEVANKELEAFAYSISHDLRAPLRSIDALGAILQDKESDAMSGEGVRMLGLLRGSAQRMDNLINDLLRFARSSREPVRRTTVDVTALVHHCLDELRGDLEARHIEVTVGDLPECQADLDLLRQVFINVLGNAVKYTGKQNHPRIEIGARRAESRPVYFVRDNGAGFDMRHATNLFGVFQRMHRADEFEGTGVGLAITARIIERHGGRIWAEAQPHRGATFFFEIGDAPVAIEG